MSRFTLVAGILMSTCVLAGELSADERVPISLFNGRDLTGWKPYLWDRFEGKEDVVTPPETVWQVQDRMLICKGRPVGYLRTRKEYQNYKLEFEWRWPQDSNGGNSGVSVHVSKPNALGLWPQSVEVQLFRRNAGDFWVVPSDVALTVPNVDERRRGRRYLNLTNESEKPFGEWNKMQVVCVRDEIKVFVNGELVNHGTGCSETRGAIALLSEGAEIHFRNIVLTPQ